MMPEDIERRAQEKIPYFRNNQSALEALRKAYSERLDNEKKWPDNPIKKILGKHPVVIEFDKEQYAKIAEIQDKIREYLEVANPGKMFLFQPNDVSGVRVIEGGAGEAKRMKLGRLLDKAPKEIKNLMSRFPQKDAVSESVGAYVIITDDPVDILRKTETRSWINESCESFTGQSTSYNRGTYSDIANGNAVAYLYTKDSQEPISRVMLRWCSAVGSSSDEDDDYDEDTQCDEDSGECAAVTGAHLDIGVEPVMYPRGKPYQFQLYDELTRILNEHGLGQYAKCTTLLPYDGYSDMIQGGGIIRYSPPGKNNLVKYAADPEISMPVAAALVNAPTNIRRALAENPKVCEYTEVVRKLKDNIDIGSKVNVRVTCQVPMTPEEVDSILNFKPTTDDDVEALRRFKEYIAQSQLI